jgi:hypothetical protein
MQFQGQGKPPLGIAFDSDLETIDSALALALLYGLQGKNEARLISISVNRPSLQAAAFCDAVARFYAGEPSPFSPPISIGMTMGQPSSDPPMLTTIAAKYPNQVHKLNDTADPVALLRNGLTAQNDQNAAIVLDGPPVNLLNLLPLPGAKDLIVQKVKHLVIAEARLGADAAAVKRLYADWPTEIVIVPAALGDTLPFPGASIEKDFAWSTAHPVADAYRAYRTMPYDAPSWAMTAALYAARPQENYFTTTDAGPRQKRLALDASQKDRIVQAYTELASAKPVPRRRFGKKQ